MLNAMALLLPAVHGDLGLSLIIFTLIIKFILFPLSRAAIRSQRAMQEIQPEMDKIKAEVKDPQEQARLTMQLYKDRNINPFSSFLSLFIQLPIIWYLYKTIRLAAAQGIATSGLLYSFVHVPPVASTMFLGIIDISTKGIILALIAGGAQYLQGLYAIPTPKPVDLKPGQKPSFGNDMARAMNMQVKYLIPIMIIPIAYSSGALALYFIASALFTVGQELFMRKTGDSRVVPSAKK